MRTILVDGVPSCKHPLYRVWCHMKWRCSTTASNPNPYYAGRGIKVCKRWAASFPDFVSDMGPKPTPEHTIERIDCEGDYEPDNCKWATKEEQAKNRRKTVRITINGETKILRDWARHYGICRLTVTYRRNVLGWDWEKCFTHPSKRRLIEYGGESHLIADWAKITGLQRQTIEARLKKPNWTVGQALGFEHHDLAIV